MTNFDDHSTISIDRRKRLDVLRMKLRSPMPGDVLLGMNEITRWLIETPEDWEVYAMLLDAVQETPELRERVRNFLIEMMKKGSDAAGKALAGIPSSVYDLVADADDAYYAAEYEKAVQLYRQVLRLEPTNARAKEYLAKAMEEQKSGTSVTGVPRDAVQFYRQARSYIAARDYLTAMKMLGAAIESAQARKVEYPEADELLASVQDLIIADEYKLKAKIALDNNHLNEALDLYGKALALEPADEIIKKEFTSLQSLLRAEIKLRKTGGLNIFTPLGEIQQALETTKGIINPDDPLLNFIEKQVKRIVVTRWVGFFITALIVGLGSLFAWNNNPTASPEATPTQTLLTLTATVPVALPTNTVAVTIEVISTITSTATHTATPSITPTETATPTPTIATLGQGYITRASITAQDKPNGKQVDRLGLYQVVTILEKQIVSGSTWYRCSWVKDGVSREGWILADYISFGAPPR